VTADWPPLRADLRGLQPYGAPQIDVPVRLNTNENPFPPSPELAAAIGAAVAKEASTLNRYPDRDAMRLREVLAGYIATESGTRLEPVEIWPANGSNEVMAHIFDAYGGSGRTAVTFSPTYSMYAQYARDSHTDFVTRPRASDFTLDSAMVLSAMDELQPDLVMLTSPNNPTGTAIGLDVIEAACRAAAGVVVVDEAYAEFRRPGMPSAASLIAEHRNLIVTRTMSKAFALAGARVGYALGSADVLAGLQIVRLPYHLSAITQVVARTALEYADELLAQVGTLRRERDGLVDWLRAQGFAAPDSDANFILFGRFVDAHRIWQHLLDRGVLVRESGPPGWLRVSIGTPQENAVFRDALMDVIAESGMIMTDQHHSDAKE
jgi:histidinol-phosphate aminotransferase